jgi:hypothetical protein
MLRTFAFCVCIVFAFAVGSKGGTPPQEENVTSGNWLLQSCQLALKTIDDPKFDENHFEAYRDGYCRGLISGVADASPRVCPNGQVTHGQQVRIVLKYLQDHPEELHLLNSVLVEQALAKSFPCGK